MTATTRLLTDLAADTFSADEVKLAAVAVALDRDVDTLTVGEWVALGYLGGLLRPPTDGEKAGARLIVAILTDGRTRVAGARRMVGDA